MTWTYETTVPICQQCREDLDKVKTKASQWSWTAGIAVALLCGLLATILFPNEDIGSACLAGTSFGVTQGLIAAGIADWKVKGLGNYRFAVLTARGKGITFSNPEYQKAFDALNNPRT